MSQECQREVLSKTLGKFLTHSVALLPAVKGRQWWAPGWMEFLWEGFRDHVSQVLTTNLAQNKCVRVKTIPTQRHEANTVLATIKCGELAHLKNLTSDTGIVKGTRSAQKGPRNPSEKTTEA